MARINYSFEKRQRELAKKRKQDAKEARRREAREAAASTEEPAATVPVSTVESEPSPAADEQSNAGPRIHRRPSS